jgi:hypothetical protein
VLRKTNVVTVANEKVSIVTVCQMLGMAVPDDIAHSGKVHCPFGELYHSDAGVDPAMRLYLESNHAYCFNCAAYFSPVQLAAKALDCDRRTAAIRLLDRIGYKPLDLATAWRDAVQHVPEPDKTMLADALKTYCARIDPHWSSRQFDPWVAHRLTRCLSLLDLVRSDDDVTLWLMGCKEVMRRMLPTNEVYTRRTDALS